VDLFCNSTWLVQIKNYNNEHQNLIKHDLNNNKNTSNDDTSNNIKNEYYNNNNNKNEKDENILNLNFYNEWLKLASRVENKSNGEAKIALVGKYTNLYDSYLSVTSALQHSCIATNQKLKLVMGSRVVSRNKPKFNMEDTFKISILLI
jgi:CTP synthase (UTP-ammonia lyase)